MGKKQIHLIQFDIRLSEMSDSGVSNAEIARRLGVTRDAVRQMLANGRDIFLKEEDGKWHFQELKPWKHAPDKGINRLTGKRAPKPKPRIEKPLRKRKVA